MAHPRVEIRLLGEPEALVDGTRVEIRPGKQQALLVALALTPGAPVSADRLIDALWGETPPPSAATTLRGLVSRLRHVLGDTVDRRGTGYVLDVAPGEVDVHCFHESIARGRAALSAGDPARALSDFDAALGLWRGAALGEVADEPFAQTTAAHLNDARLDVTEDAAQAEVALGRASAAVARLDPHLGRHPLRERACGLLMRALTRLGRQADALAAYQALRRALAAEIGVDPTRELQDLHAAILAQRTEVAAPRAAEFGDVVAFLFTDIEASTRRWEGDPKTMAAALAEHDRLLAEACELWGGHVFSHTGDGLCSAFPTAAAALGAAVAGQLALAGAAGPSASLKVRMGVHAGTVERRAGNFFGPTLNRTARVMSIAAGGQVLCSATAAGLAADRLTGGAGLRDLGEVGLADLTRPERVYQLTHPHLPGEFPALAARGGPRTNLPTALTEFIGRDADVADLARTLQETRLVTLAGPGGAGKTRLALEVARRVHDEHPDGVWFVDLAPLRDATLVPGQVAAAAGMDTSGLAGGRSLLDALCRGVSHRRMLLVLDNCEHLVDPAAELAHALLATCPGVSILATSREVLSVPGEAVFRVTGLRLPATEDASVVELQKSEAVRLFCRRAAESTPGFALTEANTVPVARICLRLDGIPLALELAAARMRLLGAHQLAERLDGLELLSGGPRTADPRHRTLTATIAWSHDLLPELERIVLRRLAVFPGSWTPTAAAAVSAKGNDGFDGPDTGEILDIVSRLIDKSLVLPVPPADARAEREEPRYRLLETIRQFAAARLEEADETAAALARLGNHLTALLHGVWLEEDFSLDRLRLLHAESDNCRAVLDWARARGDHHTILALATPNWAYWEHLGGAEGIAWLESALQVDPADNPRLAVLARIGLAQLLRNGAGAATRRRREALRREAIDLASELGATDAGAWSEFRLADDLMSEGRTAEALEALERARALGTEAGDTRLPAYLAMVRAYGALAAGDLECARETLADILGLCASSGEDGLAHLGQCLLGVVDGAQGRAESAARAAERTVAAARSFPMPQVLVMALVRAVEAGLLLRQSPRVRGLLQELLLVLREMATRRWVAETLELVACMLTVDDPTAGARCLGAAARLRTEMNEHGSIVPALAALVDEAAEKVRAALGPAAEGAARNEGATMPVAEILALARESLGRLATG